MRGPGNLHGLPWPEGDPEALRGAANRLAGLGGALEGFAGRVNGISQPAGWAGEGASSFQAASGQQARMMIARGGELRGGAGALNSLSFKLEDAQQTVTDWATRVGEAKREAREAAKRAEVATEDARQARAMAEDPLVKPLGAFNPLEGIAEVAEGKAAEALDRATQAAEDLERIRRRAEDAAREANGDVRSADGAVAAQIDGLGGEFGIAMGAPVPTATTAGGGTVPISAMAALGRFLGGLGGRDERPPGGMLAADDSHLPVARPGAGPQELRQLALLALAGDGLRSGLLARGRGLGTRPGIPAALGPLRRYEQRLGGPPGRVIDPRTLPQGTRGVFTNPALRTAARYGIPGAGLATGGLLDYMNARAEGDSAGRAAREAGVVGATTAGGSYLGGFACGLIGTATLESGGWGYASCPVLVPGGAWAGQQVGQGVNDFVDWVGL